MSNSQDKNLLSESIDGMLKELDGFVTTRTVVGDPITVNDTVIIPLIDLKFGMGAGAFTKEKNDKAAGGVGASMSPCAVLIIQNGMTRLMNVKSTDLTTKIVDMVPDIVNRFTSGKGGDSPEVKEAVNNVFHPKKDEKENQ